MDPIVIMHNWNRNKKPEINTEEETPQDQSRLKLNSFNSV